MVHGPDLTTDELGSYLRDTGLGNEILIKVYPICHHLIVMMISQYQSHIETRERDYIR